MIGTYTRLFLPQRALGATYRSSVSSRIRINVAMFTSLISMVRVPSSVHRLLLLTQMLTEYVVSGLERLYRSTTDALIKTSLHECPTETCLLNCQNGGLLKSNVCACDCSGNIVYGGTNCTSKLRVSCRIKYKIMYTHRFHARSLHVYEWRYLQWIRVYMSTWVHWNIV